METSAQVYTPAPGRSTVSIEFAVAISKENTKLKHIIARARRLGEMPTDPACPECGGDGQYSVSRYVSDEYGTSGGGWESEPHECDCLTHPADRAITFSPIVSNADEVSF